MQPVVVAQPYAFVPPTYGDFWPALLRPFLLPHLLKRDGVARVECRHVDRLRASLAAGHGIMLAPNHCRPPDPFVVGELARQAGCHVHTMASWHLFMMGRLQRFLLPRMGVFSIYREGLDREALKCATSILVAARRPLVVFPEGIVTRHNDELGYMMDGVALITRSAAKQRAALNPPGKVVVHPVALRYLFEGDLAATVGPMLTAIEQRLTWRPHHDLTPAARIARIGAALLAAKEIEHLGEARTGPIYERVANLIDALLVPLEAEWLKGRRDPTVVGRVKLLRSAIVPDLAAAKLDEAETERRWKQLGDIYLAQQLSLYRPGYVDENSTPERILETVERFEEDMNDAVRTVSPIRAVVTVGEAIEVSPERAKGAEGDPLMGAIRSQLEAMLAATRAEFRGQYSPATSG